jgi:hypothetical protein
MRHNRIAKTAVIFMASIIALAMSGATYALWSEDLYIYTDIETGEVDWEFWHPSWGNEDPNDDAPFPLLIWGDHGLDPPLYQKDVASSSFDWWDSDDDGDFDRLNLTFDCVYPYYEDHFAFAVHCNGCVPIHIWKVEFTNADGSIIYGTLYANGYVYLDLSGPNGIPDDQADIEIWWGNHFGYQLHYCDSVDESFNIRFLQPMPQNANLELVMRIVAHQYNEIPK